MTAFNCTPESCYEQLQDIHNIQLFLLLDNIPDHLKKPIAEHQFDLIEQLSTKLLMLKEGVLEKG